MKKSLKLIAVAAAATVALSACHPPNENPSDKKVTTASDIAAPTAKVTSSAEAKTDLEDAGMPGYVDCDDSAQTASLLPSTIHLSCHSDEGAVKGIVWSPVTEKKATGTGTLVKDGESTPDVPVVLTVPEMTSNGFVFTKLSVNGEAVTVH